jgi:branched-chain amino acid aminotransferase
VIALLAEAGVKVVERTVKPEELDTAREIFNTGNYGKVVPCTRYEARELPAGPVAKQARDLYLAFTETT